MAHLRYSMCTQAFPYRPGRNQHRLRRPMKDLAEAIILAEDLSRKSEAIASGRDEE